MKFTKLARIITIILCCIGLSNCGNKEVPPGDYDSSEVGKIKKVVPGVIISMRPVRLHTPGALTANNLEAESENRALNRSHGFEYVIRLNSGSIISVVQAENINLKVKQHILVISGRNTRVVPDNGSDDY
jgi:outer membrane lipoprotein SlyB